MMPLKLQALERISIVGNDFIYRNHVSSGDVVVTFLLYNESLFLYCIKRGSTGTIVN